MASIGYAVPILASRRMRGLNDEKLDDDMAKTIARVSKMSFSPPWPVYAPSDCRRRVIRAAARKSRRDGRLVVPLAGGPELPRVASDGASDWANKP